MVNFIIENKDYFKSLKQGDIVDFMEGYPHSEKTIKKEVGRIGKYNDDLDNPMMVVLIDIGDDINDKCCGFNTCSVCYIVPPKI